jgi:hypothetical protein
VNRTPVRPGAASLTWARARLRLGQSNVGFWVLVAAAVLAWRPALPDGVAGWAAVVAAYVGAQAVFDVVGGYLLPVRHGRRRPGLGAWLAGWARGVAVHAGVWLAVGALTLAVHGALGAVAAAAVAPLLGLALLAGQGAALRASAGPRMTRPDGPVQSALNAAGVDPERVSVVHDVDDRGFVGGWVGLPGAERLLLPASWIADPGRLRVILARRAHALRSGARARGALAGWAFNAVGWALALALAPGASTATASGLLAATAGFTLWAFLGLLTLPTLSRRAVLALDRHAAVALGREPVAEAIRSLDRDQEDEAERPAWQGRIFHPVPTPTERVAALDGGEDAPGLWRVTRMALYLGWAQGSWLSRAVHCNAGRPGLWAVLPGD